MKRTEPSRRRVLRTAALSGAVLGLAGCATMPSNGPAALGPTDSGNTQNTRVQLIAVPPAEGEGPEQLLHGFLDALSSDQSDFRTARMYLSDPSWKPSGAVTVMDASPVLQLHPGADGKSYSITATGLQDASLDDHGSYTPAADGTFKVDFHFKMNDKGQWRIINPPTTVLATKRDFQRIYESVNLYFPAVSGHTASSVSPLVADPVFIRGRVDNPLQTAAQQLLSGPSSWLQPVVNAGFAQNSKIVLDTTGAQAKAYLTLGADGDWSQRACRTMAAQLYATLSQFPQGSAPSSVALYQGKGGSPVCTASATEEGAYNPVQVGATAYFLSPSHQLRSVTPPPTSSGGGGNSSVEDVPGKLVPTGVTVGAFAVSPRPEGSVASVSDDGRAVYLSSLRATSAPSSAALRSTVPGALSSPSWDGTGTLWVADAEPGGNPLRAVVGGTPVPVDVQGLPQGATIEQVRVAPDGARIALLVKSGGSTTVEIGRVRRTGGDDPNHGAMALSVEGLHPTASDVSSVSSLAWQAGDALVVVGQQNGTTSVVPVEIDGSPSELGTIQTLNGVTDVTALPGDPGLWLFATAKSQDYEIFGSQLPVLRWGPISDGASNKGSEVRFPG